MEMVSNKKVCVTGGTGYLGSLLIKKLLEKGYIVHATVRNLGDPAKVGIIKSLPHADTRVKFFQANIYDPDEFELAIQGCEFVVHMANPMVHDPLETSQYKDTSEAAVAGVKSIVRSCLKSGTVKRLVYTASVVAASPIKEDGSGFKDSMDESCWTPLNFSFPDGFDIATAYTQSKIVAEKEVLSYNCEELEVVSLACGLVGGGTLLSHLTDSVAVLISQVTNNKLRYQFLVFLEELMGKVPIVHIEDVCEAHIHCLEQSQLSGRFLCAAAYLSTLELANLSKKYYPHATIAQELMGNSDRKMGWGSAKLKEIGFEYKYDVKKIIDDSLKNAASMGEPVPLSSSSFSA